MGFFEECLTLGQWLSQEDRRALYKYLLKQKADIYSAEAKLLIKEKQLSKFTANGELAFLINGKTLKYSARKIGDDIFLDSIREIELTRIKRWNLKKIKKFLAQSDVDVIGNFPLPGANKAAENGYNINAYPFYSLSYYSNGQSKLIGLLNKFKTHDTEILRKLSA